jgi:hypothetical protein
MELPPKTLLNNGHRFFGMELEHTKHSYITHNNAETRPTNLNPSKEAESLQLVNQILCHGWELKAHFYVYNILSLVPIMIQTNLVYIHPPGFPTKISYASLIPTLDT